MEFDRQKRDLARPPFDDYVAIFADSAGLLRVSLGGAGIGLRLKLMLLVRHSFFLSQLCFAVSRKTFSDNIHYFIFF